MDRLDDTRASRAIRRDRHLIAGQYAQPIRPTPIASVIQYASHCSGVQYNHWLKRMEKKLAQLQAAGVPTIKTVILPDEFLAWAQANKGRRHHGQSALCSTQGDGAQQDGEAHLMPARPLRPCTHPGCRTLTFVADAIYTARLNGRNRMRCEARRQNVDTMRLGEVFATPISLSTRSVNATSAKPERPG